MTGGTTPPQIDPAHVDDVDLLGPELVANWRSSATLWSTQAPFYVFLMGFPMPVVGRHDEVREVLLDRDRFSAAPPFGAPPGDIFIGLPQLNAMDGDGHDRLRRLLMPFCPDDITRLTAVIGTIADELLDAIDERVGTFDAMADLADPLVERALLEGLLAVDASQREQFIAYSNAMPVALAGAATGTYPPEFVSASRIQRRSSGSCSSSAAASRARTSSPASSPPTTTALRSALRKWSATRRPSTPGHSWQLRPRSMCSR